MTEIHTDYTAAHPKRTYRAAAAILAPIFKQNGWTWATSESPDGVPSEKEIAKTIRRLADNIRDGIALSGTGRIIAEADNPLYEGKRPEEIRICLDLGSIYTEPQI
jgi:hypothetical protein